MAIEPSEARTRTFRDLDEVFKVTMPKRSERAAAEEERAAPEDWLVTSALAAFRENLRN